MNIRMNIPKKSSRAASVVCHPFALLKGTQPAMPLMDTADEMALILPRDAMPALAADDGFVSVKMKSHGIQWRGADGRLHATGSTDEQEMDAHALTPALIKALTREEGLLVFFADPSEVQARHWTVFRCH